MELSQSDIDQLLRDGAGVLMTASQLYHPPCLLCGKPQFRYVALSEINPAKLAVCIRCANSRYAGDQPLWDAAGQRATNIQIWPGATIRIIDPDGF